MDPFRSLQSLAAQKRDDAIAQARRQYRKDIEAIDALQRQMPAASPTMDRRPKQVPNVTDLIKAVAPRSEPFTISQIVHLLQEAHQGQKFHYPTVRTQTSRLCSRGYLRRLHKTGQQETVYILNDTALVGDVVAAKSMADMTAEILAEAGRPLKVSEIAIAMRERGYRSDNVPNTLWRAIRDMFGRERGRFERGKDGRWAGVQSAGC